jgi:tetratricopeptide (TPR) repeat protein
MSNAPGSSFYLRLLGASLLALSACSSRGEALVSSADTAGASQTRPTDSLAAFAMAYNPGADELQIRSAQDAVRSAPQDAKSYLALAESFLVRKRETSDAKFFALASNAMGAAREIAPHSSEVRTSAVQLLFSDHRFEEAAAETRKLIATNPSNVTALLLLSDALVEQGHYEQAVDALEDANEISPDLRVYARGSYLRWMDGDQEGAIELMVDAIKMGSLTGEAVAWCYVELGMLYWHSDQLDQAAKVAALAKDKVPNYAPAIELQARIAASEGENEAAIVHYQDLLTRRSTVAAHIALSELLSKEGRDQEAAEQRARAEEMAVHDPLALALHDARYQINPEKTLKMATQAVTERSNVYTRDAQALALLRIGDVEAALKLSAEEPKFGTLDASIWLHRGLIQAAGNDYKAARASLQRALDINASVDSMLVAELQAELKKG